MVSLADATWINPPARFERGDDTLRIWTEPGTDLWQRTFYGFRNDNPHMLCFTTAEPYWTFAVRVDFAYTGLYDQAGIVVYQDSEHWMKACAEAGGDHPTMLGSVVTNAGYSDWATQLIPADWHTLWYRLSRRESDFRVDWSADGRDFHQLRLCHLGNSTGAVRYGLMACSPKDGSFEATFSDLALTGCLWDPE